LVRKVGFAILTKNEENVEVFIKGMKMHKLANMNYDFYLETMVNFLITACYTKKMLCRKVEYEKFEVYMQL